jgi:hypothetical protein
VRKDVNVVSFSHPVVKLMKYHGPENAHPSLAKTLMGVIDGSGLPCYGFGVLDVGEAVEGLERYLYTTRLLITVGAGVTWAQGMRLVQGFHDKLVRSGLQPGSIHVEAFESDPPFLFNTSTTENAHPFWHDLSKNWDGDHRLYLRAFTQILSPLIATTKTLDDAGSATLFARLEPKAGGPPIHGLLTNRHVITKEAEPDINYLDHPEDSKFDVFQITNSELGRIKKQLVASLKANGVMRDRLARKVKYGERSAELGANYNKRVRNVDLLEQMLVHTIQYRISNSRVIGKIIASPALSRSQGDFRLDWAFILLNGMFGPTLPVNYILLSDFDTDMREAMDTTGNALSIKGEPAEIGSGDLLRLEAYATMEAIFGTDPDFKCRTARSVPEERFENREKAVLVYMAGAISKATYGYLNHILW